jgi:hypothetical protein
MVAIEFPRSPKITVATEPTSVRGTAGGSVNEFPMKCAERELLREFAAGGRRP